MKNRTKKVVAMCMGALMALAVVTGCGNATEVKQNEVKNSEAVVNIGGKIAINFEGTVVSVTDNRITLDNGQIVIFDENTIFTDVNGTVENVTLTEGDYIQGYTSNEPTAAEITAQRVHIVTY